MLATPCSFPRLELGADEKFLLSKKDCRCFFDQLAVPTAVQPWTGRPPVAVGELLTIGGLTREELAKFLPSAIRVRPQDVYFPVSLA